MDNSLECPVCLNIFTSLRKPKSLACGHSICSDCLTDITQQKSVQCPLCMDPIRNPDSLAFNWFILERVNFLEVKCSKHPESIATHFHTKQISTFCLLCSRDYAQTDLLDIGSVDLSTYLIEKAIDLEVTHSAKISPELRTKIRQIPVKSNAVKMNILKELVKSLEGVKCEEHLNDGAFLDLVQGLVLCVQCNRNGQELPLDHPRINSFVEQRIYELASSIDYYYISATSQLLLKNFQQNTIETNLQLLKTLARTSGVHIDKLISCVCTMCNQEFSYPTNLPCKLPCRGMHLICEICARQVHACPLDKKEFRHNELVKITCNLVFCINCEEVCDASRMPIRLPCGVVKCNQCAFSVNCAFCKADHSTLRNTPDNYSKFFLQIADRCVIPCANEGKPARGFNTDEMKGYCHRCMQSKPCERIESMDLSAVLIRECFKKATELGSKITPSLSKQLAEINAFTNSNKLDLYKLLSNLNSPLSSNFSQNVPGLPVPQLTTQGFFVQRFRSLLPSVSSPASTKPWYIDRKKQQVEAICFKPSRDLMLVGVSISCPVKNNEGSLEYLEVIEGSSLGDRREIRTLEGVKLQGIVKDLIFDRPVRIRALENYVVVFKIDADFVYRGNPQDRGEGNGSDNTEFQFSEAKAKGFFTNGQGHISGPLIRLIYK